MRPAVFRKRRAMPLPATYAYSYQASKEIVNGKIVNDKRVKTEYNGKVLHVDQQDNNNFGHYVFRDKDM